MTSRTSMFQSTYQPKLQRNKCTWVLPHEFPENDGLAVLGNLQALLSDPAVSGCDIDFRNVEWVDTQPLLCFGLVFAESQLTRDHIILNLGSTRERYSTSGHRIFLKFFAEQGFLTTFSNYVQFRYEGEIQEDVQALRLRLAAVPQATHFLNADCIRARIIRVDHFKNDRSALQGEVEKLLKEAQDLSSKSAFGSDPLARDILFQKLRKILYELVLNVAEHSHPAGEPSCAGIYARVRGPKPLVERNAKAWTELFKKSTDIFGQRDFSPNPYAEWLELFICDIGVGLTANIQDWKLSRDHLDYEKLEKAKKAKNPFQSIVHRLFRTSFSRYPRHDAERTAVTGLQHLGHLLAVGGDYCHIYTRYSKIDTEICSWAGGCHPWGNYIVSHRDISDTNQPMNRKYKGLNPVPGTAYAFSIQPDHSNLSEGPWNIPDQDGRQKILEALKIQTSFEPPVATEWYDRCNSHSCLPPEVDEPPVPPLEVIVLRPPRLVNKQDLAKWLFLVAGDSLDSPKMPVTTFVLSDLSPFQTLTFHDLLLNLHVRKETLLDVYLVSENWAVECVMTENGVQKFVSAKEKAENFLKSTNNMPFTAANLAILLRQMDSEIFWDLETKQIPAPFFNKPVDWYASKNKEQAIRLQRYLDFPLALIESKRYHACLRALSRCLALYPEYNAIGADDLVASLVRDAKLNSYTRGNKKNAPDIIIGSIAVTAGTVDRLKKDSNRESIQIMIHGDANEEQDSTSLAALLWISQLPEETVQDPPKVKNSGVHPWRRIPNTPYIAPLGEQSISILRYKRKSDGRLDFDKPLYYGRTPEEMYNDFQRLGILKTGHWKYASRHDLLTVNMRLAFRYSFLELGPLYAWLNEQFRYFFAKKDKRQPRAQFLVYPSHPVTDTMLDRIRQDSAFSDTLPEGGMIPIKFLGQSTVSPLLTSHLVAHRIETLVKKHGWQTWAAVFFDDGTITGKHLRETTQFLQGLGAGYYAIVLLDRSGLPVQENVFETFNERHKRFWRWDVPGLGNKRNCPLCQALAIVQTYAQELSSERQKKRLKEWMEIWKVRDVDLEWHKGCLPQVPLTPPLKITFGVDEDEGGERHEKRIVLGSSTAAASLLMELTRLTTRADVTMKKAEKVASDHPDAALEMVASQLLLFLDELSSQEKMERFKKLLAYIWSRSDETEATSLAGLCFTLVDIDILEGLWKICRNDLLPKQHIGNLDATLASNFVRSKYEFETGVPYKLSENASDKEKQNFIMLGVSHGMKQAVSSFLVNLYRNPSNENHLSAHSTEIKKRLSDLMEKDFDDNAKRHLVEKIIKDMELTEQILRDLQSNLIIQEQEEKLDELSNVTNELKNYLKKAYDLPEKTATLLEKLLYGNRKQQGLVTAAGEEMFRQFCDTDEFDNKFIAIMVRGIQQKWREFVNVKKVEGENKIAVERWLHINNEVITPVICCSKNDSLVGIWLYCDSLIRGVLEDTFKNVFHAKGKIQDPFRNENKEDDLQAHMWWRIENDGNFALLTTANASANKKISLQQNANIAGLERAGGKIGEIEIEEISKDLLIAYTEIRIPLHSHFIKETS